MFFKTYYAHIFVVYLVSKSIMEYLLQERLKVEYGNKYFWNTIGFTNTFKDVFNVDLTLNELKYLNNNNITRK